MAPSPVLSPFETPSSTPSSLVTSAASTSQSSPDTELESALDRFAPIYVPLWIRQINTYLPQLIYPRTAAERSGIPFESFRDDLFPRYFVSKRLVDEGQTRNRIAATLIPLNPPRPLVAPPAKASAKIVPEKPSDRLKRLKAEQLNRGAVPSAADAATAVPKEAVGAVFRNLPPLGYNTYASRWVPIQAVELQARAHQLREAALYQVSMIPFAPLASVSGGTPPILAGFHYILPAPSVREGWPPVELGDLVNLRQLRPLDQFWQGILFEGSVAGINRSAGELLIRCDSLRGKEESLIFNVIWQVHDAVFYRWRRSTETMDGFLHSPKQTVRSCAQTWLFPEPEDLNNAPSPSSNYKIEWIDSALNEEQRNAVDTIVTSRHALPMLVIGPPGTGKTKTLVEAVLQLLKAHPNTHILVCGASGPSADTLAVRLAAHLKPSELFRLNPPSRPFAEVRVSLLPYCQIVGDIFGLPPIAELLSKRVTVSSCTDAAILLEGRCTNHDLSMLELHTATTLHPLVPPPLPSPHFGFLLIDEAAQATEADLVCAMAVVVTDDRFSERAQVTICGDPKQLGPVIVSPDCRALDLDVSLLERLADRPVYRDHPFARRNRKLNPDLKWLPGTPFVDLVKNYRSAAPILMLPSTLFYHETLIPAAPESTQKSKLQQWDKLPRPGFPILFRGLVGVDEPIDEGASFWNAEEVDYIRHLIVDLVGNHDPNNKHGPVSPSEISVISPFREQVWKIRLALRAVGLSNVDVGNVEALQGAENRVVIISTVRSSARWLKVDQSQNRGLIHEPKRWNVAMTRAKELLIVVGNPFVLTIDPNWLAFYRFCCRFKCYKGITIPGDDTAGAEAISRLEESWMNKEVGVDEVESAFDRLVGSIARETLHDES